MASNPDPNTHSTTANVSPPQSEAGLDRAGTGHGGPPNVSEPGARGAAEPTSERPADQAGPTAPDGSQVPPDPHVTAPTDRGVEDGSEAPDEVPIGYSGLTEHGDRADRDADDRDADDRDADEADDDGTTGARTPGSAGR